MRRFSLLILKTILCLYVCVYVYVHVSTVAWGARGIGSPTITSSRELPDPGSGSWTLAFSKSSLQSQQLSHLASFSDIIFSQDLYSVQGWGHCTHECRYPRNWEASDLPVSGVIADCQQFTCVQELNSGLKEQYALYLQSCLQYLVIIFMLRKA